MDAEFRAEKAKIRPKPILIEETECEICEYVNVRIILAYRLLLGHVSPSVML